MRTRFLAALVVAFVTALGGLVTSPAAGATAAYGVNNPPTPQPKLVVPSTLALDGTFPILYTWDAMDQTNLCGLNWWEWYSPAPWYVAHGDLKPTDTSFIFDSTVGTFYGSDWAVMLGTSSCDGTAGVESGAGITITNKTFNQTAAKYGSGWTNQAAANAYGSDQIYSTKKGATASISQTYANFGIVATTGPRGGTATIYVDGVKKGTVNLYSSIAQNRQIVWKTGYADNEYHTIKIVNTSTTTTKNRVTLDAFVSLTRGPIA